MALLGFLLYLMQRRAASPGAGLGRSVLPVPMGTMEAVSCTWRGNCSPDTCKILPRATGAQKRAYIKEKWVSARCIIHPRAQWVQRAVSAVQGMMDVGGGEAAAASTELFSA